MAKARKMTTLSESESKRLLAEYGVPVVRELIAEDPDGAVRAAEKIGFPVVLKGHGSKLSHKSERGLVCLGVYDAHQARTAIEKIRKAAQGDLEGLLVQPMLTGKRELVAGLILDPVFGPVVMFGLGGVFTEALDDVVFRSAPFDKTEAESMLGEIRAAQILGDFRGERRADRGALVDCLLGLSRLAMERPDVTEVDINPLIVDREGKVTAVDALVVIEEAGKSVQSRPAVSPEALGVFFHPRSIAFIGASTTMGKWGQSLPANLLAHGFPGSVYLVNPRGGKQWGRPVYSSITEIPGDVDLAVVTIPAPKVRSLLDDLKDKGVSSVLLISSGFSETGEQGRKLETSLMNEARVAGIVVLGPNTMGIQNPHVNLYLTGVHVNPKAGATALVSQSGNMGVQLLNFAEEQGLGIRAFGGSGNEGMVAIEDYLEAFELDEKTKTVLLYLESVKNGRRFFESARRVGRKKPVIVLKGGRTEAGDRAAKSHTGALASDYKLFEALCSQAGVVSVHQPIEMLDVSAVFSSLPIPKGRRVAIMTLGGGWGVVTSDLCSEQGLIVEPLSESLVARLDELLPPYWSRTNPVDLVGENDLELPVKTLEALAAWDGCDAVIHLGVAGRKFLLENYLSAVVAADPDADTSTYVHLLDGMDQWGERFVHHKVGLMEKYDKPILGVTLTSDPKIRAIHEVEKSSYSGVFFTSPERAVTALGHMCDYHDFLERECRR
ncbi:MAG: acetate--CoA ligase family protein [Desulforhopalus sp.]